VLAVEDRPVISYLQVTWLRDECHCTVTTAKNGIVALSVVMNYLPHVVIADWLIPVMDGLELCKTLR
jgi:CheY-like chemotaxis protein